LHTKVDILNEKKFSKLHYKAPGTDLTIELPDKHIWVGAGSVNEDGNSFMANMPTEEVFTLPKKDGVNGQVTSTKPLSYAGNLIENFTLTFENGKIVDVKAEEGEETLKHLIETDEGAKYLGEVALVPHQSPISQSNIIFYNTLFDENASNHLAIGSSYSFCLEGGKTMSKEELSQNGANDSITHVDFMIGSAEMDIDGIKADGTSEPVFRKGNWAF
ncbi:aminopeptidase, partial [Priestia megaterium]